MTRATPWLFSLTCLIFLVAGCAQTTAKKIGGAEFRIDDIEFVGNEALTDEQLLEHMNLGETKWFPLPKRRYYFEGMVPVDRERIIDLYAAYGYHDARVLSITPKFHPRKDVVDLVFEIQEGPPTLVTAINYRWPDGYPKGGDKVIYPEQVSKHCELERGKPFEIAELKHSEATMRTALENEGYAFAKVEGAAAVDRIARTAEVDYYIKPGPFVRIKSIEIEGLQGVPEKLVRNEIGDVVGKPLTPNRMRRLEEAIYALGVFTSVSAAPADPEEGWSAVKVRVQESEPQSVRLGVGLGIDPNRWEQHVAARYTHANLFGNLTRLDLKLRAGYAELPALYDPDEHGPVLLIDPRLRKKGFLEKGLVWVADPSFEVGIWEGYQFYSPRLRLGVSRFFTRFFELGLSHNFHFVDFFNVSPTIDRNESILGLDFRDPYTLSFIEVEANVYITDQLLDPQNGVVLRARYDIAGGIFGGNYDYNLIEPELRAYYTPIKRRLQFAARAQTGFIFPFGDEPSAPINQKFYLGGSNTMRGWGQRRLSPWIEDCSETPCRRIPIGGQTMVLGTFETRVRVWSGLWVAGFIDAGDVQAGVNTIRPQQWNYAAGPGLRYDSPVGTFRADFGVRINDDPRFQTERRWAFHLGLGEAF